MSAILRYPGGKGRFANTLSANVSYTKNKCLIEPFAGGAAAGLTLLEKKIISHLVLVEKDPRVSAFWIKLRDDKNFFSQVESFSFASKDPHTKNETELLQRRDNLQKVLDTLEKKDLGMWTLVKNRCSFGGYLDGGLLVKGFGRPANASKDTLGKREYAYYEGVGSQWNGKSLSKKIKKVHDLFNSKHITFIQGDAFDELPKYPDYFAFIDPPYTLGKAPGIGLYQENIIDHPRLFKMLRDRIGPWIATYNNCEEITFLAEQHKFKVQKIKMNRLHADTDETNEENYHEIIICPRNQNIISDGENIKMGRTKKEKVPESITAANTYPVTVSGDGKTSDAQTLSELRSKTDRQIIRKLHKQYQDGQYGLQEFIRLLRG